MLGCSILKYGLLDAFIQIADLKVLDQDRAPVKYQQK